MEEFNIRLITTEEEFESVVINAIAKEGWRPGLKDAECYLACDPTGTFVLFFLVKYGDNYVHIGAYVVHKEYRGKGYGLKIFNAAVESVKPSRSIGLSALQDKEQMYQRSGFHSHFNGGVFAFHLPTAVVCFSESLEQSPVTVKCIDQVDQKALFMYDSSVFGFERHPFLSKWLCVTGSRAHAAINKEGAIVGYVVARPTFVKEDGYRIGPLFTDSESIAEMLLKALFEELLQQEKPPPAVIIDTPTEFSQTSTSVTIKARPNLNARNISTQHMFWPR
ncbi:hypothetical protein OS493_038909 [Desmophyllum pertusum]|uniref:N-acetyltransferase domain-containing protein n=1 Tax=Desmophyllum pertusum TaxID=174260 RepID=A0A9X0D659_9CNID|nr:hypothetical protein OS493_038909 [Desmophyllum pertusum]